ncbi:MAG: TIGR03000 domain-containing protein [Pirellulales bacterium]
MSTMSSSMPVDSYRVITDEPVGDKAGTSGEEVETPVPAKDDSTSIVPDDGVLLLVSVPADAKVFVNGSATTSTGSLRRFVSRGLAAGAVYDYTVKVVLDDAEEPTELTKTVSVSAGERSELSFVEEQPTTSLTLRVPADATVWLAGNATGSTGELRAFETTALAAGEVWQDYEIRVVTKADGRERIISKVINLTAGETVELEIDPTVTIADASLIDATASIR